MITEQNDKPAIPINADDIENEILNSVEKKAHSSVKYGDFLISDVTELFNSSHNNTDSQALQKKLSCNSTAKLFNDTLDSKYKSQNDEDNNKYTIIYSNEEQIQTKPTNPLYLNKAAPKPTIVDIKYEEPNPNISLKAGGDNIISVLPCPRDSNPDNSHKQAINPDKVVKILSEKTISEPVLVAGKLEPMSPSMIIRRPVRKLKSTLLFEQSDWDMKPQLLNEESSMNINLQANNNVGPQDQANIFGQIIPMEYAPINLANNTIYQNNQKQENMNGEKPNEPLQIIDINSIENQNNLYDGVIEKQSQTIPIDDVFMNSVLLSAKKQSTEPECVSAANNKEQNLTPNSTPVYKSILKSKITPEKLAAIEEKRKFNLKLRDVITSCLDNLEEQNEVIDKNISQEKKHTFKQSLHSKESGPTSNQGSMIAYLEKRLQRMEDALLNKIDHNTQRINELKRTIKPSKHSRNVNTQTYLNHTSEQSQKQYLYKEISKFLSPNANIKIYEELFMADSQDDSERPSPRKLRRRR